jgi:cystathionine beta-synthase
LYQSLVENPSNINTKIEELMGPELPIVSEDDSIDSISKMISKEVPAILVKLHSGKHHIITKYDIIQSLS